MGTWNSKIERNDTFQDIYQNFFELYNKGENPISISKQVQLDFADSFSDYDDKNNSIFGLALAQWETQILDPKIYAEVKQIIQSGNDIEKWKELGADEKTLKKRQIELDKFLAKISEEKTKPKRRVREKFDFTTIEIFKIIAPDDKKQFEASEHFVNGIYEQTGSLLSWINGGTSIFYFNGQGQSINAKWIDSQAIEVTHDKNIVFTKMDERFHFYDDEGTVVYKPINVS